MEKRLMDISLHLLDLGKRNRLINYKSIGYRAIEVHQPSIETIFDKLTSGITLSIFPLDPVLQKYHKIMNEYLEKKAICVYNTLAKENKKREH